MPAPVSSATTIKPEGLSYQRTFYKNWECAQSEEALRYLQNAKDTLSKTPIEDDYHTDIKPVREALGTAHLAILEAINEALLKKGCRRT